MSGLLRRIRRPGAAEETRTEAPTAPAPAHGSAPASPAPSEDGQRLPAGAAPEDVERRIATGRRGKLRRRARFLRRARELALRDLGGLVYEAHRREQDGSALVKEKVQHLAVLDTELHGLETQLGTPRGDTVLREPGVGGTCPRCGELHASDARFCSACGLDLTVAPAAAEPAPAEAEAAPAEAAAEPAPADGAATPSDATAVEPAEAAPETSEQPTTEVPAESAQAANGRAKTSAEPAKAETPKPPA